MYTTLLMSTGITSGATYSLFGLAHTIVNQGQNSALVATAIGSAVISTVIANAFYLPRHLDPAACLQKSIRRVRGCRAATAGIKKNRVCRGGADVRQNSLRERWFGGGV